MSRIIRNIKKTDFLTIALKEEPSKGHRWKMKETSNFFIKSEISRPLLTTNGEVSTTIVKTFVLSPKSYGEFEIEFIKIRSWEKNSDPIETYCELINVE